MGLKETILGLLTNKESKPFEPNELQNHILGIAARWRMEETPWWTGYAMGIQLENDTGKNIGPGTYYTNIHELERKGALTAGWGGSVDARGPLREVPPFIEENRKTRYYKLTGEGQKMRGILEVDPEINISGQIVPEPT